MSDARGRTALRLLFAVLLAGAVAALGATGSGGTLRAPLTIVGYPIYADFDPNRYLVAFYFVGLVFPLGSLGLYLLAARLGPLRVARRARPPRVTTLAELGAPAERGRPLAGAVAAAALVGGVAGLELAVATNAGGALPCWWCAGGAALVALLGVLVWRIGGPAAAAGVLLGGVALQVALLVTVSAVTVVTISPGAVTVHYRFFPWWLALVLLACAALLAERSRRRGRSLASIARGLVAYVSAPLLLFLLLASLPGPGGRMDTFGEGEYLGGSYLLLHGALPWRDLYLIHGLLDDGLKPLVGFALFGMTRWGASAGLSFLWAPAYWIATYLFATVVFGRRWFAAAAAGGAVALGVFADWDVRYLFWPLLLALFAATLRRRSWRVGALLGLAALVQFLLIPEMLYAAAAVGVTLVVVEFSLRRERRPRIADFPRSLGAAAAALLGAAAFALWLVAAGATSGFIGYFRDFASAHSLSGGIPLFTNYAIPARRDALGVLHLTVSDPGWFTRYSLELVLPVAAVLVLFAVCCVRWRARRALYLEDWVAVAAALVTLAYFPKALSRADVGHIGESFAVAVPLLCCLAHRGVVALDGLLRRALGRGGRPLLLASPAGLALVAAVLAVAPSSPLSAIDAAPAHFRNAADAPPPPAVNGAGGLGYEAGALPDGLVRDLATVIATYGGRQRAVFDFTNAPGLFDFLLAAPPASRFYDINLTITEAAQQQAVRDLEAVRPPLVVFGGVTGLPRWDYLDNEVRDHIVSVYLLDHYRPLASVDGELVLLRDTVRHPAGLPRLVHPPVTTKLYDSGGACAFGYIPDFLPAPAGTGAVAVALTEVPAPPHQGRVFRFVLPALPSRYRYVEVTRSQSAVAGSFVLSNLRARSRRDISWAVLAGRATTAIESGACLQWHGFSNTLFLRYKGPGTPTSLSLIP